jgi:hypothetical protein
VHCKEDFGNIHEFDQHCKSEPHLSMMKAPSRQKKYTLDYVLSMCKEKNFVMEKLMGKWDNWPQIATNENVILILTLTKNLIFMPQSNWFSLSTKPQIYRHIWTLIFYFEKAFLLYNKIQSHFEPVEICKILTFWFPRWKNLKNCYCYPVFSSKHSNSPSNPNWMRLPSIYFCKQ